MTNKVCYITNDNVRYNLIPKCVQDSTVQMGSDGFTNEVPNGHVVIALNHYNNMFYQAKIEVLQEGEFSQCAAPDDVRGITSYYVGTEDVLKTCAGRELSLEL